MIENSSAGEAEGSSGAHRARRFLASFFQQEYGKESGKGNGVLHLLGFLSLAGYGALSWQSRGVDPVSLTGFFLCLALAWVAVCLAFWILWRSPSESAGRVRMGIILFWAVTFRVVGVLASPVLAEDDYFRFLWDGYRFAETGDPYRGVPADFFEDEEVPELMASLLYDINYPELPTIYGPVMEVVFLAGYSLEPASLLVLKLLFVLFEGLLLFLLSRFLTTRWFLVAAWCPLLVFETSFQGHPDIIGVSLMVAAFWAAQRRHPWLAMVLLGLATCAKPFAILLWPFIVSGRLWFRQGVSFAGVLALIYLPFVIMASNAGVTSLGAMATGWEFNAMGYSFLKVAFGESARAVALVLFGGVYVWLVIDFWRREQKGVIQHAPLDLAYGALFFFSPVINSWYLLWLFPFVMLKPRAWSLVALVVVSLSYATGLNLADRSLAEFEIPPWVRGIEIGLIAVAAGYGLYRVRTKERQPSGGGG